MTASSRSNSLLTASRARPAGLLISAGSNPVGPSVVTSASTRSCLGRLRSGATGVVTPTPTAGSVGSASPAVLSQAQAVTVRTVITKATISRRKLTLQPQLKGIREMSCLDINDSFNGEQSFDRRADSGPDRQA